jgi:putative colanic acid biosynthesis UDP-glucose lipid carrier transferase
LPWFHAIARDERAGILFGIMRRFIDLIFAMFWLVLTSPILLLIAIGIKLDSPGPILYMPAMTGKHGKPFRLFRFRTMHIDQIGPVSQQRFTRLGLLLRNYSLDHLLMLINMIKGDLTLVGPRPMEIQIVDMQDPTWHQYFQVKPGIFNYAVLRLGNTWTPKRFSQRALNQELELEYLKKRSPIFDLQIFLQFLRAFFASRGNVKARGKPDVGNYP